MRRRHRVARAIVGAAKGGVMVVSVLWAAVFLMLLVGEGSMPNWAEVLFVTMCLAGFVWAARKVVVER